MTKICINIEIDLPELNEVLNGLNSIQPVENNNYADLLLEDNKIELKIFFNQNTYLDERIGIWIGKNWRARNKLTKSIKILKINEPEKVISIDFSVCKDVKISWGSNYVENDTHFFILNLDRIEIEYNPVFTDEKIKQSELFLTPNSVNVINQHITISAFLKTRNVWESKNCITEFVKFGEVEFLLDFYHYTEKDFNGDSTIIKRTPVILIKHENISYENILIYSSVLCSLLSYYSGLNIDYKFLRHHTAKQTKTSKKIYFEENQVNTKLYFGNYDSDVYNLISGTSNQIIKDHVFLQELMSKLNLSRYITGSTRFLILFSILELLRGKIYGGKKSKEKFSFNSPDKIDEFILLKLDEIKKEIKSEEEKEIFERIKKSKLDNIKYISQVDQFNVFLKEMDIKIKDYQLSIPNILKLRNRIIHGSHINQDDLQLSETNKNLNTIVEKLIYRFLSNGIY
jgi:hypothetical protein